MSRKYTRTWGVQGNVEGALLESMYGLITFLDSPVCFHDFHSFSSLFRGFLCYNNLKRDICEFIDYLFFIVCVYLLTGMQNVGVSSMQISAQSTQRFWVLIKSTGKPWHLPQLAGPRHLHLFQTPHRLQITKFSTKAHFVDHCSEPLLSKIQLHLWHSPLQNLLTF